MATFEDFAYSGVSADTPKNTVLGAGALYKNGKFTADGNFTGDLLGATSGGVTVTITPEMYDIEADGVMVKAKGLAVKIGETATLATNLIEITPDTLAMAVIGEAGTSEDTRFDVTDSKPHIEAGDYIEGLTYVTRKTNGEPIAIVFDYALCTSGLEFATANKENSAIPVTFECYADLAAGLTNKLPYHIYTPKATV